MQERSTLPERTCKNCIKATVCKHVARLERLIGELPQYGAPQSANVLYEDLALACLLYQKKKK